MPCVRPASLKVKNWSECTLPPAAAQRLPEALTSSKAVQSIPWFSGLGLGAPRDCVVVGPLDLAPLLVFPRTQLQPFHSQLSLVIAANTWSLNPASAAAAAEVSNHQSDPSWATPFQRPSWVCGCLACRPQSPLSGPPL